jgi:glycosyltransferase involved in cell wall biosynthesis
MKVKIQQFLGKQHSWSVCGWNFAESLLKLGHKVDLFSTDGIKCFPDKLKPYLIGYVEENKPQNVFGRLPDSDYDCQISYTAMKNFPNYLSKGSRNRFGVWIYEWIGDNILPTGFAKNYKYCDKLLSPSNFGKEIFVKSGVPEDKIYVLPHGINNNYFLNPQTIDLKTNKRYKIFSNIIQNHIRKNIPGLLEAYGKAFTDKDDVCLILKANLNQQIYQFDINIKDCLKDFYSKYPHHGEIRIFSDFVENIADLYYSCNAVFTMSHCEGFYFPGLEGLAAGIHSIAPNYGGQLDFLNSSNSLLVDGKETRADPRSMYWESKPNGRWFNPSIDDAVEKLRYSYNNFEKINCKINRLDILNKYGWDTITKELISLCQN